MLFGDDIAADNKILDLNEVVIEDMSEDIQITQSAPQ
jgi:hypothetical protein